MSFFNLSKQDDMDAFEKRCYTLKSNKRMVELTDKTNRTISQNRYLYLLINCLALELGIKSEDAKRLYKEVNQDLYISYSVHPVTGLEVEVVRSTSDLTIEEMSLSIVRFRNESSIQFGIYLPSNKEKISLFEIEKKTEMFKEFL